MTDAEAARTSKPKPWTEVAPLLVDVATGAGPPTSSSGTGAG
jgi:hypothetical protein